MTTPPNFIDGARVLLVAELLGTRATGKTRHIREGVQQTKFAGLAIARYPGADDVYLFYCDDQWNCLNDTCHDDVAAAEAQAAFEYDDVVFVAL